MKTLLAVVLVFGLVAELTLSQGPPIPKFRKNILSLPKGSFGKGPPKPGLRPSTPLQNKDRLQALKDRLSGRGLFSIKECNLKRVQPFQDPVIKRTGTPGSGSQSIPSSIMNMAISRTSRTNSPEATAARSIQQSSALIQASVARAKAADRSRAASRSKRQTDDMVFMAETLTSEMCQAREKLIMSVENDGDTCYTIAPQEVKYWECQSSFASGMTNPYPAMQDYFCEPDNYVYTSWYVICPFARGGKAPVRIQTAHVPINCACTRYKCNFEPYQSDVALDF